LYNQTSPLPTPRTNSNAPLLHQAACIIAPHTISPNKKHTLSSWTCIKNEEEGQNYRCHGNHQLVAESLHCWLHQVQLAPPLGGTDPACVPHPYTHPPLDSINRHLSEEGWISGPRTIPLLTAK